MRRRSSSWDRMGMALSQLYMRHPTWTAGDDDDDDETQRSKG